MGEYTMRSYEAARGQFTLVEWAGRIISVVGIIVAVGAGLGVGQFSGTNGFATFMAALPGLGLFCVGTFLQVHAQTSRAAVDSAEYAQQALKVARDQFELSKEMFAYEKAKATSPVSLTEAALSDITVDTTKATSEPPAQRPEMIRHMGRTITADSTGFHVDGTRFPTLEEAKSCISEDLGRVMQPLISRHDPA